MIKLIKITSALVSFPVNNPANKVVKLNSILGLAGTVVFWIGVGLSLVAIMQSGIKLMQSKGDPREIQSAQQALTWSVAGMVVVLAAGGIVTLFAKLLGIEKFKLLPDF